MDASEILLGAIDMHVHAFPDNKPRLLDTFDVARAAAAAGMKGIVLKDHSMPTADRAWMARQIVTKLDVWGSVTLNKSVGSFNPDAVEAAISYGAKVIWFATNTSASHLRARGKAYHDGLTIFTSGLDAGGEIRPEVRDICRLIAHADVVLATGHLHADEVMALIPAARDCGVTKLVVTHPENKSVALSMDQCAHAVQAGAYLEFCCRSFLAGTAHLSLEELVALIQRIGTRRCVLASDLGASNLPAPVDGLKQVIARLLEQGVTADEIREMLVTNPTNLLSSSSIDLEIRALRMSSSKRNAGETQPTDC